MAHIGRGRARGRGRGGSRAALMSSGAANLSAHMFDLASSICNLSVTTINDTPGDSDYIVGDYGVLIIDLWGGGAGSNGFHTVPDPLVVLDAGTSGAASTIGAYSLSAGGGTPGNRVFATGAFATLGSQSGQGGTATGGNSLNADGANGGLGGGTINVSAKGGDGGAAPGGGAAKTGPTDSNINTANWEDGLNGNAPGGGAAGGANVNASSALAADGAGSGGHVRHVFIRGVTVGAPNPGDHISYHVGAAGLGGLIGGSLGVRANGADGSPGRVTFQETGTPAAVTLIAAMFDQASSTCSLSVIASFDGAQDFDYTVPDYETLTIEMWGGGASGGENTDSFSTVGNYNSYSPAAAGNNGGNTVINSLSLNAKGGLAPVASAINNQQAGGLGQTPTGGGTNTIGAAGESNLNGGGSDRAGAGGSAPSGGAGGARITGSGNSDQGRNGNDGVGPGGGGSGDLCSVFSLSDGWHHNGAAGGASGGRLVKVYNRGEPGAPSPGDVLHGTIGAGGAAPNANPGATRSFLAGKGADGRANISFTPPQAGEEAILRKRTVYAGGASGTHTPDVNAITMNVRIVGAGSGGSGSDNTPTVSHSAAAEDTTFGPMTAHGATASGSATPATATGGDLNVPGGIGSPGDSAGAGTPAAPRGGSGAASYWGQGGGCLPGISHDGTAGGAPGSGGGGGIAATINGAAPGGNSGAFSEKLFTGVDVQAYAYDVGQGSVGANSVNDGGQGADGQIVVDEYW